MRVVFLGSPEFALPSLAALLDGGQDVVAVVTQPDRPAGRGHRLAPPPVKEFALPRGLNVLQPEKVSSPESVATLTALRPDVLIIAAYGQILRQSLLDVPARGSLNVHASLLPRHRGASPIAAAILAGDEFTGVTIMEVVRALDAGPMVARVTEPILDNDTTGTLEQRLAVAGGKLLGEVLTPWARREIAVQSQDDAEATSAPMLRRDEARIDWSLPAVDTWRRVRAFNPWPLAFTAWRETDLRILGATAVIDGDIGPPGLVIAAPSTHAPGVVTGNGVLMLEQVQLAGRKPASGVEFLRGHPDFLGSRL